MRVVRWAGENISPSDDGRLFDQIFGDGLLQDVTIAPAGAAKINIGPIYGIICGREFTTDAMTINAALPTSGTKNGFIYAEIDTSKTNPLSIKTKIATTFTPVRQDINVSGTVAQVAIGWYTANATAVTQAESNWAIYAEEGHLKRATVREVIETLYSRSSSLNNELDAVEDFLDSKIKTGLQTVYEGVFGKNFETGATTTAPLFLFKTYACGYTVPAGSARTLSAESFGISAPTGYRGVAIMRYATGNNNVLPDLISAAATGTQAVMVVRNVGSAEVTAEAQIYILFVKTSAISSF